MTEWRLRGTKQLHAATLPGDGQFLPALHTGIDSVLEPSVVDADPLRSDNFLQDPDPDMDSKKIIPDPSSSVSELNLN